MAIPSSTREVFAYFQNLNLLVLLDDLRRDRTARGSWSSGAWLCPVAHGLSAGRQVRELKALGQAAEWGKDCFYAASSLGADPGLISRFVRSWDEQVLGPDQLLKHLEELWQERLEDAQTMQEVLAGPGAAHRALRPNSFCRSSFRDVPACAAFIPQAFASRPSPLAARWRPCFS